MFHEKLVNQIVGSMNGSNHSIWSPPIIIRSQTKANFAAAIWKVRQRFNQRVGPRTKKPQNPIIRHCGLNLTDGDKENQRCGRLLFCLVDRARKTFCTWNSARHSRIQIITWWKRSHIASTSITRCTWRWLVLYGLICWPGATPITSRSTEEIANRTIRTSGHAQYWQNH